MNLYWSEAVSADSGVIKTVPKDGSAPARTLATNLHLPGDVAVGADRVYWAEQYSPGSIRSCPLAGCAGEPTSLASGLSYPRRLAVDGARVLVRHGGCLRRHRADPTMFARRMRREPDGLGDRSAITHRPGDRPVVRVLDQPGRGQERPAFELLLRWFREPGAGRNAMTFMRASVGSTLGLSVYLPSTVPNPYWVGDVQMFLTCRDAGVFNAPLGWQGLTGLPLGTFSTLRFTLDDRARAALQAKGACEWDIALNVAPGTSDLVIDALRFL